MYLALILMYLVLATVNGMEVAISMMHTGRTITQQ